MAGFKSNPDFRVKDFDTFWLMDDLIYQSEYGKITIVPQGFATDWASIPRIFWAIMSPMDDTRLTATLHDYLYSLRGKTGITRKQCDDIFLEASKYDRPPTNRIKAHIMYYALRLFGWISWNKKK